MEWIQNIPDSSVDWQSLWAGIIVGVVIGLLFKIKKP